MTRRAPPALSPDAWIERQRDLAQAKRRKHGFVRVRGTACYLRELGLPDVPASAPTEPREHPHPPIIRRRG